MQAERRVMRVYQYLRLTRAQKEHFAALWRGWKRRRRALDSEFSSALSLLDTIPSTTPRMPHASLACMHAMHGTHACIESPGTTTYSQSMMPQHCSSVKTGECHFGSVASGGGAHEGMHVRSECFEASISDHEGKNIVSDRLQKDSAETASGSGQHDSGTNSATVRCDAVSTWGTPCKHKHNIVHACQNCGASLPHTGASADSDAAAAAVGCELLGVNGKIMERAHAAMEALRGAHAVDERMQGEFSAMITLPSWGLSQVCC